MPNPISFTVYVGSVNLNTGSPGVGFWSEIPTGSGTFSQTVANIIAALTSSNADNVKLWEINPPNNGSVATSAGGTGSLALSLDHTTIRLNTGNVDYFSLPAGFQILTMNLKVHVNPQSGTVNIKVNGIVVLTTSTAGDQTISIPVLNNLDFNDTFEFDFTTIAGWTPPATASISANAATVAVEVTGTCTVNAYGMTLVNPGNTYNNGDTIRITASGGITDLRRIKNVVLKYIDGSGNWQSITIWWYYFTLQTFTEINFLFPNIGTIVPAAVSVNLVDDGTQFNGSVLLGFLTAIVSTDNSGIYQFTPGKTNDTLYIAGGTTTSVVAIPNPFVESSFVP